MKSTSPRRRVVIVGGGFAGLALASRLSPRRCQTTLLDTNNYHLFQPLLYQVATGSLSSVDIATPLRMVLRPNRIRVVQDTVIGVDRQQREVLTAAGHRYGWDALVLAFGFGQSFFGHDEWAAYAPSLKSLSDAFQIRNSILGALERAEVASSEQRERLLRFVVVGAGPTGVELAGALAELTRRTLARDFQSFDPRRAEIMVVEAAPRILPQYSPEAAANAEAQLERLGVSVLCNTRVESIGADGLRVSVGTERRHIDAANVIWAAGAQATPVGVEIARQLGVTLDRGRFPVDAGFEVRPFEDVFAIGDLAAYPQPLPGLATAAEQAGRFLARRFNGKTGQFRYRNLGQLAVIGRNAAVGNIAGIDIHGPVAWWVWLWVHIRALIGFDVKLKVMLVWTWKFLFDRYEARIISDRGLPDTPATAPVLLLYRRDGPELPELAERTE